MKIKLSEAADIQLGKRLHSIENKGTPLLYLRNLNVRWGEFDLTDILKMRFEESELKRYNLINGDLLICEGGEPGRCAIWNDELPGMLFQMSLIRLRGKNGVLNNLFFMYWLRYAKDIGFLHNFAI